MQTFLIVYALSILVGYRKNLELLNLAYFKGRWEEKVLKMLDDGDIFYSILLS